MIPLTRPYITADMENAMLSVLRSGMLSEGEITAGFEKAVADYTGAKYAVACSNCTAGLEMALMALNLQPGDEIIVPDFTYPATATAVLTAGYRVVLADIDRNSLQITPEIADKLLSPRTRAIMPVPVFGNPLEYDKWRDWSRERRIVVIEDAAPALGTFYKGKPVGSFFPVSVFSFHPRKNLTTGEGGMIVTDNRNIADWLRSYKRFGSINDENGTRFERIGSNRKLSDLLSALGLKQLEVLDEITGMRATLAERYLSILSQIREISFPEYREGNNWQTFCVFVDDRDRILNFLRKNGVEAQIGTYSLHGEKAFKNMSDVIIPEDLENSSWAATHTLALPLYPGMRIHEQDYVVEMLKKAIRVAHHE